MFGRRRARPVYAPKPRYSYGQPLTLWERHLERGLDYFSKGKNDEALADLDAAIEADDRIAELYATRGMILVEMGKEDQAHEDLAYALELDARQWLVHYVRGLIAYRKKAYDDAIEALSLAQRYVPLRPEVYYTRACVYYERGDLERARDDADYALQTLKADDKRGRTIKRLLSQITKDLKAVDKS
ncbi:MAG: tetratricopeptide repeat protein [Chloroflexi bacterium]|nr:tetratricopeptide repeat protein [Chloroflexota bacterium]